MSIAGAVRTSTVSICESAADAVLIAREGACPAGSAPWRGAGVNIFDAFWDASSGQAMGKGGSFNQSVAALASAKAAGVRYFRFFASDWGPNKVFWARNESQYWSEFDRLWDEIDRLGLSAIPSIGTDDWHLVANEMTRGLAEDANAPVTNSSSVSRHLVLQYFSQFVKRYRNRTSVLLWELGNELNLLTNLPPPHCGAAKCFDTAQMVQFTRVLAGQIRQLDSRPISSGFSLPRPSAWHQEHCPYDACDETAVDGGTRASQVALASHHTLAHRCQVVRRQCPADPTSSGYWATDTREQWLSMLAAQQQAVPVWSIHTYAGGACFFDAKNCTPPGPALVAECAAAAKASGAVLFVGEYGGPAPNYTGPTVASQAFPASVLDAQVADAQARGAFALSAIWAWECPTHRADMNCIWPNSSRPTEAGSRRLVTLLQAANKAMRL